MRLALKSAEQLGRLNYVVLGSAIVVYLGMVIVAISFTAWLVIVFATCILLAEILVYFFIRASLAHFALIRGFSTDAGSGPGSPGYPA
jgi:hypothetical protein